MTSLKIYLASGNPHKARELQKLATDTHLPLDIHSAAEVGGMPEVVEDTGTFVGNARKKAVALQERLPKGTWTMSDDSGICVDALDGGPGVESAYFSGPAGDDDANLRKLVEVMKDVPSDRRGAHYVCVLVLRGAEDTEFVFEGKCHGSLVTEPTGTGGFGYDPLFIPSGYDCTFGVLPPETKQALSHRAQAWMLLAEWARESFGD